MHAHDSSGPLVNDEELLGHLVFEHGWPRHAVVLGNALSGAEGCHDRAHTLETLLEKEEPAYYAAELAVELSDVIRESLAKSESFEVETVIAEYLLFEDRARKRWFVGRRPGGRL